MLDCETGEKELLIRRSLVRAQVGEPNLLAFVRRYEQVIASQCRNVAYLRQLEDECTPTCNAAEA